MFDAGPLEVTGGIRVGVADQVCSLSADTPQTRDTISGLFLPNRNQAATGQEIAGHIHVRDTPQPRLRVWRAGQRCGIGQIASCVELAHYVRLSHPTRVLYAHTEISPDPMLEAIEDEIAILQAEHWLSYLQVALFWLLLQDNTLTYLHAAVVGVAGTAVVLVGASGAGKSTLSYALADGGGDYFTDECAWFTRPGLHLHPWLRPLALRPGGLDALGLPDAAPEWHTFKPGDPKWFVSPHPPQSACPLDRAIFVFLEGFGDAPALRPMPGGEATRRLLRGLSCGPVDFGERMGLAARLVSRYPCWGLRSGPPAATADLLRRHVEERT